MSDFPLLPLPTPEIRHADKGRGFPIPKPRVPGRQRQGERLGPIFDRLASTLNEIDRGLIVTADPSALAPERVVVFEVAGSIGNFANACNKIQGLEYLAEQDVELECDSDFWVVNKQGEKHNKQSISGRFYAAMPDLKALSQLLALWKRYQKEPRAERGLKIWFDLFGLLHQLRTWGPQDRLSDDSIKDFRQRLNDNPHEQVLIEVELWYYSSQERREQAESTFISVVGEAGGELIHKATISAINYHAALINLPLNELATLLDREHVGILACGEVMLVRPQCSPCLHPGDASTMIARSIEGPLPDTGKPPIAALFDGVPIQKHNLLDGRIEIDDPDEMDKLSLAKDRKHGTAMASLILHGYGDHDGAAIDRLLHIRPVMYAPGDGHTESFRNDRLLVDTIYQAVLRMKVGLEDAEPTAPEVFLVNISLADAGRPYAGWISPWARLLDYLAYEYDILFMVSAGNISGRLPIPTFRNFSEMADAQPAHRESAVLEGIGAQRSMRTLLSPAEGLNVMTVGAAHAGKDRLGTAVKTGGTEIDPYISPSLPNISSALGLGHRRSIKPDILMPGGQELVRMISSGDELVIGPVPPSNGFGISAASPDEQGRLDQERMQSGTSVATALATREAHFLFEDLLDADNGGILASTAPVYYAPIVRALLVHLATWEEISVSKIENVLGPTKPSQHIARRENVARLVGYGMPKMLDGVYCKPERATLIGYGNIKSGQMAICRLPLPASLSGIKVRRTVTATLAWFSPVNSQNSAYRMGTLEFKHEFKDDIGTGRAKSQPSSHTVSRGTLIHQQFIGKRAVEIGENGELKFRIICKAARASDIEIRYGLVVSIEAEPGVPVYQEIQDRLAVRPRV